VSFFPLQKTRSRGVEVLGAYRPIRWFSVLGGYTYTDAIILENPSDTSVEGKRVPDVSRHFATLTLQYHGLEGLRVALRGRYQDARFNEATNENKFGEHFVLDLSVSYAVNRHVEVFLLGENLTDKQYVASFFGGGQLAAPLQIFGGVRVAAF
jgi:outer membrane receptor protein involved in Fe transport